MTVQSRILRSLARGETVLDFGRPSADLGDQLAAMRLGFHIGRVTAPLDVPMDQPGGEAKAPVPDDGGIEAFLATNPTNQADAGTLELDGVSSILAVEVGGFDYAVVTGADDDGISVFRINANGTLTPVHDVTDAGALELDGARHASTAMVDGNTYIFVTGQVDNGISVFRVGTNGSLTSVANFNDDATVLLGGAYRSATATIGTATYLYVAGSIDDGITIFRVAGDGRLTHLGNVTDASLAAHELDGASGVMTVRVGANTFLVVSGNVDDGISVFQIGAGGLLTHIGSVTDTGLRELDGAIGLATAVVAGITYVYASGYDDDGISVFSMTSGGVLTSVQDVTDSATTQLNGVYNLSVMNFGGAQYLAAAGVEGGITLFRIMPGGLLEFSDNLLDTATLRIGGDANVTSANVGGETMIVGGSFVDDGVSVFGSEITGQIWYSTEGNLADARIGYFNTDGFNHLDAIDNNPTTDLITGFVEAVVIDSAAGRYYALVTGNEGINARLVTGLIGSAAPATVVFTFDPTYAGVENNLTFHIDINPFTETLYIGFINFNPFTDAGAGIRQFSYNPLTGAVSGGAFLVTETTAQTPPSTAGADGLFASQDMAFDTTRNVFYSQNLALGDGFETNTILRFSLTNPGGAAGVSVINQTQFPLNGNGSDFTTLNGIIADIEIDEDSNRLYFLTRAEDVEENTGEDSIWMIANASTAVNATAVKLTLVGISQIDFYPEDMTLDEVNNILYVESENSNLVGGGITDVILVFQLDAAGTTATLINTIDLAFGTTANLEGMHFNHLVTMGALTATGTVATEQSTAVDLLTAAPTIADFDGDHLASATVQITGGTFNSNENSFNDDDLGHGSGMTQSGLIGGTNITISWDQATGTLTLTGYDTFANYQAALNNIHFQSTGNNPTNYGLNTFRTITWTVSDGLANIPGGQRNSGTTTVNITAINDAPVNTVMSAQVINEDATLNITGLQVTDPDANPAITDITVTLTVLHGTLTLLNNVAGGLTAGDIAGNGTGTVTITATINEINATFSAASSVTYAPNLDYNGSDTFQMVTNDGGNTGNDPGISGTGTTEQDSDQFTITINPVNDAPVVAGDGTEDSLTIFEDQPSATGQTVSSLFLGQFTDQKDNQVPNGGVSVANTFIGVAVVANASSGATGQWQWLNGAVWTDIGTASLAAAKLFNDETQFRFNPAADYNGPEPLLTVRLIDSSGGASVTDAQVVDLSAGGATGGTTRYSAGSVTLGGTVLPVNDAPTSTNLNGDNATWTENGAAVTLDAGAAATIADIDSPNFDTGTLTVALASPLAQDGLFIGTVGTVTTGAGTVSVGGVQIGTFTGGGYGGGPLVITFDADATPAAVQELVRAIQYNNNAGDNPTGGTRTVNWTLVDGDGTANLGTDTLNVTTTVNVVAVNDAPQGTDATFAFNEDGSRILAAADFGFSDPAEGNLFAGVVITTLPTNGVLLLNGVPITVAGTFVTAAQIAGNQLVFQSDANENGTPYATFTFQVRDDGGVLNGGVDTDQSPNTLTFNVNPVNDAPTSTNLNGDAATYAEGAAFALLDVGTNATVADIDSADFDTGTLTVSITGGLVAAEDQLVLTNTGTVTFTANTVSVGGTQIATYTGGGAGGAPLVFTFDADATPANVQALVRAIGYTNSDLTSPTGGVRTIGWTLVDGDGVALGGADTLSVTTTVDVINVNSAPQGTDASITLNEDGSRILAAADFGYSDPAEGDNFAGVVITTLPTNGVLLLNGVPITVAGTFVTAAQISANQLVFQPDADENGTPYGSFTFQVRDDGGIANGGQDTDQSANTLTFNVNPVNDAPTSTNLNGDSATWVEGSAAVLLDVGSNATIADIDSANFDTGTLTVAISGGVVAQDGLFIEAAGGITTGAGTVSFMGTQIGTFTGGGYGGGPLVFTFDADATPGAVQALVRAISYNNNGGISPTEGLRTIGWTLVDGDGVALGGADTLNVSTTVDVQAINDAPTGTDNSFTINEDATYTFAASSFGFGDINGDLFAGVVVTTIPVPGTLFYDADGAGGGAPVAVTAGQFISAADIALGRLYYTPVLDGNGVPFSSFTFQVRDDGGTGNGGQDTDQSPNTVTFNVTAVNDAPTNSVPGGQTINEDASLTLSTGNGNAISVGDVDATTLTVTLSVAHGTLTLASTAGLTFSGGSDGTADASMTFSGTAAAINAALGAGLTYNPTADFNGSDAISVVTTDNGQTGTGPVGTDSDSIAISITAINDAPVVIGDGTESAATIDEDMPGAGQTIQALFAGQYSDAADNQIPNGGASSPGQFSGIAVTANGSSAATGQWQYFSGGVWTDIGAVSDAAAKLFGDPFVTLIRFNPAPNYNGPAPTLTVHLIDNSLPFGIVNGQVVDLSGVGATGGTTAYSTGTVVLSQDVTAVNDAPVNNVPGAQTINEDGSFTLSTGNGNAISVADVDATTLTVTLSVAQGTLTLASIAGLSFGAGDGSGDATMTFSGTAAAINAALGSGLTYNPTANYNGPDSISVLTTDNGQTGNGGTLQDSDSISITVNSVNDAPSGANNTLTGSEDDPLVLTLADFGFSDPIDGNAFAGVVFTTVPTTGTLFYDADGPGGGAPVALANGAGPIAAADIAAGRVYFVPVADAFGSPYASFTFQVQDDGGITNGGQDTDQSPNTMTIDIAPDNLPPAVDLDGGTGGVNYTAAYTEDGAGVAIGSGVTVTDPNSGTGDMIESATIVLTDRVAGDSLTLTGVLPPGIVAVTTPTAGAITIQITGSGTGAQYQALIQSILYATTSQDPTVGGTDPARTITVTVNDGTISSAVATTTVNVTALDDAPVAQPDAFTITESGTIVGGNLFADNGSGADSDPDGPPLSISAVNGSAGNVNTQITLASGALLTVNSNGTFNYDPNTAYLPTPTAGSGASNTPGHDSFTYTLAGGNTVTVSITLTGLDTDDTLLGTAGADILMGGNGDDLYFVENGSDQVIEAVGAGYDRVFASVSYALAAGAEVEVLSTASWGATTAINLTGNAFGNVIYGNAGANTLNGGGGTDVLIGFGGDDNYFVDSATDAVIEDNVPGLDSVFSSVNYGLAEGSYVEVLSAADWGATTALSLAGNSFANIVYGNAGANLLDGGGGADVLIGFGGDDAYIADNAGDVVIENAGQGYDTLYVLANYALAEGSHVEVLSAADWSSTAPLNLTGNSLANTIYGNAGANILSGGGGADALVGFGGNDTYYVDSASDTVFEAAGGGNDAVYASASYTLGAGQEIEFLSADNFSSTAPLNLTGNELANTIYGNAGVNILDGKGGSDALVGLDGADVFAFTTALGAGNVDLVFGFVAGSDKIALDDAIFGAGIGTAGAFNANAFHVGAAAHDLDDRIIYNSATGQIFFDADGSGAGVAVQFATLSPGLALTASDFQVI